MDVADHLQEDQTSLRRMAKGISYRYHLKRHDPNAVDELFQEGALVLMETHAKGRFLHRSRLLTYAYRDVLNAMLRIAGQYVGNVKGSKDLLDNAQRFGLDDDLVAMDEMGRVDALYEGSPMDPEDWLQGDEAFSTDSVGNAGQVLLKLTDEDREVLEAYGEHGSIRAAAEALGMSKTAFARKLKTARQAVVPQERTRTYDVHVWRCRVCDRKTEALNDLSGLPCPCGGRFVSAGKRAA